MNDITTFNFQTHAVRTVTDENGEPWFVAKDVCDVLEIQNPTDALKSLEEDERMTLDNTEGHSGKRGGAQFFNVVNESGLYALIFKSRKPEAKAFRKWVTSEVLPALRKTGTYTNPANAGRKGPHKWGAGELSTAALAAEFRAFRSFALAAGLKGNPATISADTAMRRIYGVSPLGVMQIELQSEEQQIHLNPTEIAQIVGLKGPREVNRMLEEMGMQRRPAEGGKWMLTDAGKAYGVIVDSGKAHNGGQMVQSVRWLESIVPLVRKHITEREEKQEAA